MRVCIDYDFSEYKNLDNLAMIILPGGFSWSKNSYYEIVDFLKKVRELRVPIAAICGATLFLSKNGFLDNIKHTGDDFEYFKDLTGYHGHNNFVQSQIVVDNGFITANETAAVDFAYEIFKLLKIDSDEEIDEWFDKFKNGMVR